MGFSSDFHQFTVNKTQNENKKLFRGGNFEFLLCNL